MKQNFAPTLKNPFRQMSHLLGMAGNFRVSFIFMTLTMKQDLGGWWRWPLRQCDKQQKHTPKKNLLIWIPFLFTIFLFIFPPLSIPIAYVSVLHIIIIIIIMFVWHRDTKFYLHEFLVSPAVAVHCSPMEIACFFEGLWENFFIPACDSYASDMNFFFFIFFLWCMIDVVCGFYKCRWHVTCDL